jgi:hypothetical protein
MFPDSSRVVGANLVYNPHIFASLQCDVPSCPLTLSLVPNSRPLRALETENFILQRSEIVYCNDNYLNNIEKIIRVLILSRFYLVITLQIKSSEYLGMAYLDRFSFQENHNDPNN